MIYSSGFICVKYIITDKFDYKKLSIGTIVTHQNGANLRISEEISFNVFVKDENPQSISVIRHRKNEPQEKFSIQNFQYIDQFVELIKKFSYDHGTKKKIHIEDINNIDIGKEELKNILQHQDKIKIIVDNNLLNEDLTKAVILKQRSKSIAELEKSINESKDEGWFQKFFEKLENHWILGNAIDFTFVHIESKHDLPTSDGQRKNQTDFISQNLFGYCSVVEIKTPKTILMKQKEIKSDPPSNIHDEKGTHVYIPHDDLIVGVSQVIHYQNRGVERSDSEGTKKFASNASGLIVIGHSKELVQNEELKRSFQLYHNSIKNVTIMTYDELLKRAKQAIGYDSNP